MVIGSDCACFGRQQRTSGLPASELTAASAFRFFFKGSFFLPLSTFVFFFLTLRSGVSAFTASADDMAQVPQAAHAVVYGLAKLLRFLLHVYGTPQGLYAQALVSQSNGARMQQSASGCTSWSRQRNMMQSRHRLRRTVDTLLL